MAERPLGKRQLAILKALIEYKGWQRRCGWVYDTASKTQATLDTFVNRGYVRCEEGFYTPIKDADGNPVISTVTRD